MRRLRYHNGAMRDHLVECQVKLEGFIDKVCPPDGALERAARAAPLILGKFIE